MGNHKLLPTRIFPVFFLSFLFACKKEIKPATKEKLKPEIISPFTTSGPGGTDCYSYSALIPQADGSYTGYVENVAISVTNIIYQAYDDNGNPIAYQEGDAFVGQVNLTSNYPAQVLSNTLNPQDDQFSVRIWQMGVMVLDLDAYQTAIQDWATNVQQILTKFPPDALALALFNGLQMPPKPDITSYLKPPTTGVTYHDVTARLIRIHPQQVQTGTDALGNPIFATTSFAVAPSCYPRNDLRQGTTGGQATIAFKNIYSSSTGSPDITVDFFPTSNPTLKRTFHFPTTRFTTGAAFNINPGSYTIQYTIPPGYSNNFYGFVLNPKGTNPTNYWDTSTGSVTSGGSRYVSTGTFTISSGTAYILQGVDDAY